MKPAKPLTFDCPYRILFGPLYFPSVLGRWLGHPNIRTFNFSHDVRVTELHHHLKLEAESYYSLENARFEDILAQLPPGWEPDLVVWYNVSLMAIPAGIENCPYPTLGVIHDWPLNFHPTLDYAGAFDYIVAEHAFLDVLRNIGYERCSFWPCYSHDPMQHLLMPGLERPYDIAFLGNMDYHYHRDRNRWLERIARLGDRYRVLISDRYYRDDFTRLLNQTKLAFNFAVRGEMNIRIYEIAACGAVVLSEEDNLHIRDFMVDGESCVLYNDDNLEAKIIHYLEHPEERQRIARNGVQTIAEHDYEHQFARLLDLVPTVRAAFEGGGRQAFRARPEVWRSLLQARHLCQCLTPGSPERGQRLLAKIERQEQPQMQAHVEAVTAALNLNRFWQPYRPLEPGPFPPETQASLQQLEAAVIRLQGHPWHLWHAYNLACGYSLLLKPQQALPLWQQLIPHLATVPIDFQALSWLTLLPRGYDREMHDFNYLWDKTAGDVLGGHKPAESLNRLLLWQAYELSGYCLMWVQQPAAAIQAFYQAETYGPGSFYTYTPLLQLLLRTGQEAELLSCLQRAVGHLGLIESLQRDLITTLARQGRWAELMPVLEFYRLLMQCFEGGSTEARESIKNWIPAFMSWIPELLEQSMNGRRTRSLFS